MHHIEFSPEATPPLTGLRVIDLSRLVAGNMVSLQLADHGAEVIKIEDPIKGDPLRAWRVAGVSVHWKVYARNKKSFAISLRDPECLALLGALIATADVLIENFRPGTLEAMGFAPDTLWRSNPKLIVLRVSGFGQDGPYAERPGFGSLIEGMSGFASMNGFADREPVLPPLALADMVAGLYGAFAVMIARREVEKGGKGQVIDLPLLDPMISILGPRPPRSTCRANPLSEAAAAPAPPARATSFARGTDAGSRFRRRSRPWPNACCASSAGPT